METGYAVVRRDGSVAHEAWVRGKPRPEQNAKVWASFLEEFNEEHGPFRVVGVSRDA